MVAAYGRQELRPAGRALDPEGNKVSISKVHQCMTVGTGWICKGKQ
jgi:hypothetical protein